MVKKFNPRTLSIEGNVKPEDVIKLLIKLDGQFKSFMDDYVSVEKELVSTKEKIKKTETELYKKVKQDLENSGKRVTEKAIENEIKSNKELMELKRIYLDLQLKEKELDAEKEIFANQRFILSNIVKLFDIINK